MDLVRFSLENYRRFHKKTSVNLHGPLIAFVGPNEAGKTSLLEAMAHLGSEEPFQRNEMTRRLGEEPRLWWHFQLGSSDKSMLAEITGGEAMEKVTLSRGATGELTWELEPHEPARDISHRTAALEALRGLQDFEQYEDDLADDELPDLYEDDRDLAAQVLESESETLEELELEAITATSRGLRSFASERPEDESLLDANYIASLKAAAELLDRVVERELLPHPRDQVIDLLTERIPPVVYFTQNDRDLHSSYELTDVADDPPPALSHLAALADLDLGRLRDEAVQGEYADIATRRNNANAKLLTAFTSAWNQQGIAVQFDVQGTALLIQATTPEDNGLSSISDRSEGMRWFAALLAFINGWVDEPILLADEIETHLHYDAQADLVNVLSSQKFTSKVIYTTHSFGCLPNDLGNGVRAVEPLDSARSRLRNDLWSDAPGFSPLLASMGASAVAFTPSRRAVVGEGACEAILLPTLLRQAAGVDRLSFQVVPGLSVVAQVGFSDLQTEAGRIAYFVDGDAGGEAILDKLTAAGVPESATCVLRSGDESWELEDMIDPQVYVTAVNAQLSLWTTPEVPFTVDDLGARFATKRLATWCASHGIPAPDKAPIAQRVVELAANRNVVAEQHRSVLVQALQRLHEIFGLPASPSASSTVQA